jgi:hypothetical protein
MTEIHYIFYVQRSSCGSLADFEITAQKSEQPRTVKLCVHLQISYRYMKNAVFWDVAPCGSCYSRYFGRM